MKRGASAAAATEWRRRAKAATNDNDREHALAIAYVYEASPTYADAQNALKLRAGVDPFDDDEEWATNTEWPWPPCQACIDTAEDFMMRFPHAHTCGGKRAP